MTSPSEASCGPPKMVSVNFDDEEVLALDLEAERATFTKILDEIDEVAASYMPGAFSRIQLDKWGLVTPWIAKQLGRYTGGSLDRAPDAVSAIDLVLIAVRAGWMCGHRPTFHDNLLSLANIQLSHGLHDEAEKVLRRILSDSSPECLKQRGVAHLNLSQIEQRRGRFSEAGHHMQMGLCLAGGRFPEENREHLLGTLARIFSKTGQFGAVLHVAVASGLTLDDMLKPEDYAGLSTSKAIASNTLLEILQNSQTALQFRGRWLKHRNAKDQATHE